MRDGNSNLQFLKSVCTVRNIKITKIQNYGTSNSTHWVYDTAVKIMHEICN